MAAAVSREQGRMPRKALSKRLRFEIFKRDGFRCVYCGATPANALLHVDHVKPVAEGGTNDPANLVTSCGDCNGGKSAVPLDQRRLPALDPEAAKEHAEQLRAYLEAQKDVQSARSEAVELVLSEWDALFEDGKAPDGIALAMPRLVREHSLDELLAATDIIRSKPQLRTKLQCTKYFFGILRRRREDREAALTATKPPAPTPPAPASGPTDDQVRTYGRENRASRAIQATLAACRSRKITPEDRDVLFALIAGADCGVSYLFLDDDTIGPAFFQDAIAGWDGNVDTGAEHVRAAMRRLATQGLVRVVDYGSPDGHEFSVSLPVDLTGAFVFRADPVPESSPPYEPADRRLPRWALDERTEAALKAGGWP